MASTSEYRKAIDTTLRALLTKEWGQVWADDFCDGLLLRLIVPCGNIKIHIYGQQLNIDTNNTGGYTNDITSDPLEAIGVRLGNSLVCDPDAV